MFQQATMTSRYRSFRDKARARVILREGGYTSKNIDSIKELYHAYKLRHDVFSCELRWVPRSVDGMEVDKYDKNSVSFGVFDGLDELQAYLRLITTQKPYMLEREFACLVGNGHKLIKDKATAEISRLCVAKKARKDSVLGNFGVHNISMFLYKGVYHWCRQNYVSRLYLVVESKILRLLCSKGFPCKQIGDAVTMPDGVDAVAAIMDWREFEDLNAKQRPKMLSWFTQHESAPTPARLLRHVTGLQHQISP